jgi:hypothetical protein
MSTGDAPFDDRAHHLAARDDAAYRVGRGGVQLAPRS